MSIDNCDIVPAVPLAPVTGLAGTSAAMAVQPDGEIFAVQSATDQESGVTLLVTDETDTI